MTDAPPILELRDARKSFGGVRALAGVNLTVRAGEVHGLLGQNGCGKSTLIKLLAGFHAPESGTRLTVRGEEVELPVTPGSFDRLRFAFVHQDLGLVPALTVTENLALDRLSGGRALRRFDPGQARRWAADVLDRYGVDLDPTRTVDGLDGTERALLAIVRAVDALRRGSEGDHLPGLLVLDEPTVFLPRAGVDRLFNLVREVAASGSGVLFVSHDLGEVREITDRITVLRDGREVATVDSASSTTEQLVALIVGRELQRATHVSTAVNTGTARLRCRGVATGQLAPLDLDVAAGEIVGLGGLMGSAYDELVYALAGAARQARGEVDLDGAEHSLWRWSPRRARAAGIALVPANRPLRGIVGDLSVGENVSLAVLDQFRRLGLVQRGAVEVRVHGVLAAYNVKPSDPELPIRALSGGNQQKALIGKWLQTEPALLLLHEPTQGVDVGSREEIYQLLEAAARDKQMSILCSSIDHEELARLCDRVVIFAGGDVVGELRAAGFTADDITERVFLGYENTSSNLGVAS